MQGAQCRTPSWDSRITPWAEGGAKPLSHPGIPILFYFKDFIYLFMRDTEREREAETQAEGEAGSMHWEPDVGLDPRSPESRPGPRAGAKPLRHPGIP